MRPGTKRRWQLSCRIVLAATLVGVAYAILLHAVVHRDPFATALVGALIGALHGFMLGATIGPLEIFGGRARLGRAVEQAPFLVTLLVKGFVYGSIAAFVNVFEPGTRLVGIQPGSSSLQVVGVIFSFLVTLAFIFVLQISQILGGRTLRDWVLGRYHRPRQEERFFLFVDIVGSTSLAERLGPVGVHHFLNRVFLVAADPVDDHRGEIFQYVGDEMVITWTEADGQIGARPVRCFVAVEAALDAEAPEFLRDFGVMPRVRGALHAGPVIVGEVGGRKRAIVFHGDVMNTTSRLEQVARELDRRLVVSATALSRLAGADEYGFEDLGDRVLRGRSDPVQIYTLPSPLKSSPGGAASTSSVF